MVVTACKCCSINFGLSLGLYISVITGTVTASIISTIFITQLHHRGAVPLPRVLRTITFDILARLVCFGSLRRAHGTASSIQHKNCAHRNENGSSRGRMSNMSNSVIKMRLLNGQSPITLESEMMETSLMSESTNSTKLESQLSLKYLQTIENKLEFITEALSEYERRRVEENNAVAMREEWAAAAKVYDRFFFIIFVILMSIVTVKFLVPESGDKAIQQWGIKT